MKKRFFITVIVNAFIITVFAQEGFYIHAIAGYGMGTGYIEDGAGYDVTSTSSSPGKYSSTFKANEIALGKGLRGGIAFGYMFNKNAGLELGTVFFNGAKNVNKYKHTDFAGATRSTRMEQNASSIRLSPSVIFTTGEKVKPYVKFGFIYGINNKVFFKMEERDITSVTVIHEEYSGRTAYGFRGALGAAFALSNSINLFLEFEHISQNFVPYKSVVTKYEENGTDRLPSMTTREKETRYVSEYRWDNYTPPDENIPIQRLYIIFPLGSISANTGIKILF